MLFEYSYWWVIPMLLVSGGVAYFKFKKISKLPDISRGINLLISSLRFLSVFLLLFLLLKPTLTFLRQLKEKPFIIVAQDNSASLLNNKDSSYYRNEYEEFLTGLLAGLDNKFDMEWLTFDQTVRKNKDIDFGGHYTNISRLFSYIDEQYIHRSPKAVILLSDGVYNTGLNPRYKLNNYPVYTVILGDTTEIPDVYIKEITCDKFNFVHTIFPLKAEVAAIGQEGRKIKCVLKENGKVLETREVYVDRNNFLTEETFGVEAERKGLIRYTLELETGFEERSGENNKAEVYVHILDNRGNVAIYYTAPHPDIAAITDVLQGSGIYTSTSHSFQDPLTDLNANLIILHNPEPGNSNYQQIVKMAKERRIAVWNILTTRESIQALARYGTNYQVSFTNKENEYATPAFNRNFPYFEFTEEEINGFAAYPPLVVPFGEIKTGAGRELFTQKIKTTVTANGMFSFYDDNNWKVACLWGEGLWKWKLFSFKENGNHELFNTLIYKTVNYLANQRGNERFLHDIKPLYDETEEMVINVELYNESYELVNTPDVSLSLKYNGKDYNYILNRNGEKYRIRLGNLMAGEYVYDLSVTWKGEHFAKQGSFYVRTQNPELNDQIANYQLMKEIAEYSGGECVELADMEQLLELLNTQERFTTVSRNELSYADLGELKWLGILLLIMLCIEWFLLKYFVD